MATAYGSGTLGTDSNFNEYYLRSAVSYSTSETNTQFTVSGTAYVQHTGAADSGSNFSTQWGSSNRAEVGLESSYASWSGTYANGTTRSGVFSSVARHTSWTNVVSVNFSFTVNKTTSQQTRYLISVFNDSYNYGTYRGSQTGSDASAAITIPKISYSISYNANGGSGAPSAQSKLHDSNITLSSTRPTRSGYVFKCWNTNSSGTGTDYNPGATFSTNANTTLYAIWQQLPNITSVSAVRVDADGSTPSFTGGRAVVSFQWSNDSGDSASLPSSFSISAVPSNSSLPTLTGSYTNSESLYVGNAEVTLGVSESYMGETVYRQVRPDVSYTVTVTGTSQHGSASTSYTLAAATAAQYSRPTVTVNSSRATEAKQHDICGQYVYLTASYTSHTDLYRFVASFEGGAEKGFLYDSQAKTGDVLLGPYTTEQLRPENAYTASVSISDKFYTTVASKAIPKENAYVPPTVTITKVDRVASDGVTPDALGGYVRISGTYAMTETETNSVPSASRSSVSDTQNGEPITQFSPTGYTVSGRAKVISVDAPEPTQYETLETDWIQNYANAVSGENEGLYYGETSGIVTRSYYWSVVDLDVPASSEISVTDAYYEANFLDVAAYDERKTEVFEAPEAGGTFALSKSIEERWGVYVAVTAMENGSESTYEYTFYSSSYIDNEYIKYLGDGVFTIPDPLPSGTTLTSVSVRYHIGSQDAIVVLRLQFEPEDGKTLDDYVMTVNPAKKPAEWLALDSTHAHFNFAKQDGEAWFERPAYSEYVPKSDGSGRLYVEFDVVSGVPAEGNNVVNTMTRTFSRLFGMFPLSVLRPDAVYYATSDLSDRFNTARITAVLPASTTQQGGYIYPSISEVNPYRIGADLLESDDGTDFRIDVNWSIYASMTQVKPEAFNVRIVSEEGITVFEKNYDYAVTSGNPSIIYVRAEEGEEDLFSQDLQYTVTVTVMDRYSIASLSAIVTSAFFTWDAKRGGHGIAFGKPSTREIMDVRFPGYFDSALHIAEELSLPVYVREKLPKSVVPSLPAIVIVSSGNSRSVYLATRGTQITADSFEAEMHTVKLNYDAPNRYWDPPNHAAAFEWPCTLESGNPGWYSDGESDSGDENPYWWTCVELPIEQGSFIYNIIDAYLETDTGAIRKFVPETGNGLNDYIVSLNPNNWPLGTNSPDLDLDPQGVYFHFKHFEGCGWHPDSSEGKISGTFHVIYEVQTI